MSSEPNNPPANSSDWYSPKMEYEGEGRAEFSDPEIVLEGTIIIKFDENGNSIIKMTKLKNILSNLLIDSDIIQILNSMYSGNSITSGAMKKVVAWRSLFSNNKCKTLTVKTLDGIFSANDGYNHEDLMPRFSFLKSKFNISSPGNAKYWVLPISNFISEFRQRNDTLNYHPLRINPDNNLIIFEFNGGMGFIEQLNDYNERKDRLLKCQKRNLITAMMVGEVGTKSIDFADLDQWFPFNFLDLLGLATGNEVGGGPWIEFRDATGNLVQRIHTGLRRPIFFQGHRAIDEVFHHGTGRLLTKLQTSPHYGESYLTAVITHIVQSQSDYLWTEDRMNHLFLAFDCVCKKYELDTQDLSSKKSRLDRCYQEIIETALKSAKDQILAAANDANANGYSDQCRILEEIANRAESTPSGGKARSIGISISDLLKLPEFDLPDFEIVDSYYQHNPRPDGILTLSSVLSYYRGTTMHKGYFDFHNDEYKAKDVPRVRNHLYDICIRIVLKMLEYDGMYNPAGLQYKAIKSIDWVKPDTPPGELGYE
ncbi:MAG: hypothetical protein NUK54_00085 [Methanothrix sp.]|nr:hypothetical protein [Methanothrix sp.]